MTSDFLVNCKIEVKSPVECSEKEISEFYEGVKKGGKVMLYGLKDRIKGCELLAFCHYDGLLVGVSAIKRPNQEYVIDIITKTGIERKVEDLTFEIGYSFTENEYRRKGISKELKKELLNRMKSKSGTIFSTTAVKSSQNFLEEYGFKKLGKSYDGENDKEIGFYEKKHENT